jgi:hypothetical protein
MTATLRGGRRAFGATDIIEGRSCRFGDDVVRKARLLDQPFITSWLPTGLELVAAGRAYERLLRLQGKVRFSKTLEELKADR